MSDKPIRLEPGMKYERLTLKCEDCIFWAQSEEIDYLYLQNKKSGVCTNTQLLGDVVEPVENAQGLKLKDTDRKAFLFEGGFRNVKLVTLADFYCSEHMEK